MNLYLKRLGICTAASAVIVGFLATHKNANEIEDAKLSASSYVCEPVAVEVAVDIPEVGTCKADNIETLSIPELDTSFKSYMDYRTITCKVSTQYKMQQEAYTDELGLRKIGDYYCVALGTYYSPNCGKQFRITTDTGNEFDVIVSDIKNDIHTDKTNRYVPMSNDSGNVLEFVVDISKLDDDVKKLGNIGGYEKFSGNIVAIKPIGKENKYA